MAQETAKISREVRDRINDAIRANPETLAEYFLPPGLVSLGRKGRFSEWNKSKKSAGRGNDRFLIEHNGTAPRFANYRDGAHGRGVHYIERHCGVEWHEAYRIAAGIYGIDIAGFAPDLRDTAQREAEREARRIEAEAEQVRADRLTAEKNEAAHVAAVRIVAALSPADTSHPYAVRKGISLPSGVLFSAERITARLWNNKAERFQDDMQAVPAGALVIPMQDAAGETVNLQTIPADPKGRKLFLSGGQTAGLFHVIPGIEPGYLVEGFATGCTVAEATGRAVFVAFSAGNLPAVAKIAGRRVAAVAADHDQSGTGEAAARKTGLPYRSPPKEGDDWNDAAATYGLAGVAARLAGLIPEPPEPPKPRPPAEAARRDLGGTLSEWFASDAVTGFAPGAEGQGIDAAPALLLPVGTGIGKTMAALQKGLAWKAERPDAGPIVVSVPMHSLAEDIGAKLKSIAPDATFKIWQGRGRDGMCENKEAVRDYTEARASVGEYCRTHCPFKDGCAYLAQSAGETPTVWIVTHALLTETPPKGLGKPCLLIVDEQFWNTATTGTDGAGWLAEGLRVSEDFDRRYPGIGQGQEVADRATRLMRALEDAAERSNGKPIAVTVEDLARYGFTPEAISEAIDQTGEVFNWLIGKKPNRGAVRKWGPDRAALARLLGCLREIKRTFDAKAGTVWRLTAWKGREDRTMARRTGAQSISAGWAAPMLFLDATANATALRAIVPQIVVAPAIEADTPHARHQWRKTKGMGAARQRENTEAKAQDMARIAWMRWRLSGGGSGLIVCHKVTHEHMTDQGEGFLPPGWSVEHFKNTTGRDDWKNVRFVEIFGRVLQPIEAVEMKAIALTSNPVITEGEGIKVTKVGGHTSRNFTPGEMTRFLPDGSAVTVGRYSHPDPMAEAILRETLDGELIQCAGRARAVNRTEANPVTITLHGDTYPEGLPLDDIEADALAHPIDKMLAAGRGKLPVLTAPTDAVAAYPELWGTPKAAIRDFQNSDKHKCPNPYIYSIKGFGHLWSDDAALKGFDTLFPDALIAARYQKAGERQKWKKAFVPAGMVEAFPAWIADTLGCAVRVEWIDTPPPPEPPRPADALADPMPDIAGGLDRIEASLGDLSDAMNAPLPPDQRAELLQVACGLAERETTAEERGAIWAQMALGALFDAVDRSGKSAKLRGLVYNLPEHDRAVVMTAAPWLAEQGKTGMGWMAEHYGGSVPPELLAMAAPKRGNLEAFL